jgi:hypothetical protein
LEHLVEWSAQVGFDDPPDQLEGFGRYPVAQEAELVNKLLGEEALTRRDDLSELDIRRSKMFEGAAQSPRKTSPRRTLISTAECVRTVDHVPEGHGRK